MTRSERMLRPIDGVKDLLAGPSEGLSFEEKGGVLSVTVAEKGMIESVVRIPAGEPDQLIRITAKAGSRSRFLIDAQPDRTRFEFDLAPYACADVFFLPARSASEERFSVLSQLRKHASLNVWTVTLGGSSSWEHAVRFAEEHAFAAFWGLSVTEGSSHVTHRLSVFHEAPHCTSRQFYKCILAGSSRTDFESLSSVAKGAVRSDSRQLNKNLILSKKAKAVSRPELRIDADDVSASHGSATGELSEDSLFYLKSRGISASSAREMLIRAFASEIIESMPDIPLREDCEARILGTITTLLPRPGVA